MKMKIVFLFISLLLILPTQVLAQSDGCLSYEPKVAQVTGTVERKAFPGRPNYESIEDGDEPEVYWILKLTQPICVKGTEEDDVNTSESDVTEMQLVLDAKQYKQYKSFVGRKVIVTGMLFHAITAHHKTKVLITVKSMVAG